MTTTTTNGVGKPGSCSAAQCAEAPEVFVIIIMYIDA